MGNCMEYSILKLCQLFFARDVQMVQIGISALIFEACWQFHRRHHLRPKEPAVQFCKSPQTRAQKVTSVWLPTVSFTNQIRSQHQNHLLQTVNYSKLVTQSNLQFQTTFNEKPHTIISFIKCNCQIMCFTLSTMKNACERFHTEIKYCITTWKRTFYFRVTKQESCWNKTEFHSKLKEGDSVQTNPRGG